VEDTRALLQAAYASSSPHIVYTSNVGVDHTEYFYYQGKYETELLIEQGQLPWTIVRHAVSFVRIANHPVAVSRYPSRGSCTSRRAVSFHRRR
jgi:uncharacterized protein YbjT (DUF2867 family)